MKVQRSAAVSLLVALGAAMAGKWDLPKMLGKLKKIDELVDGGTTLEEDDDELLKAIRKANEAEEDIEIEDDTEKSSKSKSKAKKSSKKAKAAKSDDDEGEEEDEDEEEEEEDSGKAKKSSKKDSGKAKAKAKKAEKEDKGPGVIASIIEFLKEASSKNPISKADLVKKLAKRFPDRGEDSMKSTVNIQVPSRLVKDKDLNVKKNDDGYWISKK